MTRSEELFVDPAHLADRKIEGRSVAFITMGCAKNEVDTSKMKDLLKEAGAIITDDLGLCDIVIVNTCSFIQSATEESIDAVLDSLGLSEMRGENVPVVVAGCMPARYGSELSEEMEEVAAFVPCSSEDDIVAVVAACLRSVGASGAAERLDASFDADGGIMRGDAADHAGMDLATDVVADDPEDDRVFAYVKISDGCDRWCSYCTIPIIRGRYHSFTYESIEKNVASLVSSGKKEIILIAQDTGRWGDDLDGDVDLAWLIDSLASKFPSTWFRVMYIQPQGITDALLGVIAKHENVCSYLDIPLQHVNAEILHAMNRPSDPQGFRPMIAKIKEAIPDIALRTTLIAGFPGETEDQFEELVDFVEEGHFDYVGVFPYSREEGTLSSKLPDQLDEGELAFRAARIAEVADAVSAAKIALRQGSDETILVEGIEEDGQLYGRCQCQAPEVDGVTFVDFGNIGSFVEGRIVDTLFYDMEAEM